MAQRGEKKYGENGSVDAPLQPPHVEKRGAQYLVGSGIKALERIICDFLDNQHQ